MNDISDETVQRMVELVRKIADKRSGYFAPAACLALDEAQAIIAELPKPVDPDVAKVRAVLGGYNAWAATLSEDHGAFQSALAAFKRVKAGGGHER